MGFLEKFSLRVKENSSDKKDRGRTRKKRTSWLWVPLAMLIGFLFAYLFFHAYDYRAKTRRDPELAKLVTREVMEATLLIVEETHGENRLSYGAGFSGVIFREEGENFFFLTALHALETTETEEVLYRVLGYEDLTFAEYFNKTDEWPPGGLLEYYDPFPLARLEYSNEAYDLAILSFTSQGDFSSIPLTEQALKAKDPIISIGNPHGERNLVTYGRIWSLTPAKFKDASGPSRQPMIRHSAYVVAGSSGGLIMSASGEIAGITLGGGEDLFRHFRYVLMMPADRIQHFISDWEANR